MEEKRLVNIILEGFMGTGKTTVGKAVARILGYDFLDTDPEVCRAAGKSIHDMLVDGELPLVRQWEEKVCRDLSAREHAVISTGGGVFVNENNARCLSGSGFVVCLERPFEEIYPLISTDPIRTLAYGKPREDILALLESRIPAYHRYANLILQNTDRPEKAAEEIVVAYRKAIGQTVL